MKNILVSLLSGQMIPNILLARELEMQGYPIDTHLVITTEQMQRENKTETYRNVLGIPENKLIKIVVKEDSIVDMKNQINPILDGKNFHSMVNITGGTKIMSLAAVESFRNKNSEFFYLPISKNTIGKLDIHQGKITEKMPIQYRTTIREYLASYSIKIQAASKALPDEEKTQWMSRVFLQHTDELVPCLEQLQEKRNTKQKQLTPSPKVVQFLDECQWNWSRSDKTLSKKEVKFLTGDWLEQLIHLEINRKFPDLASEGQLLRGVQITNKEARNEVDIICIQKNAIHIVECKSVLKKNFFDEIIYKIAALRKDFGLNAISHLVVGKLDPSLTTETGEPNERFKRRINVLGIKSLILETDGIKAFENLIS